MNRIDIKNLAKEKIKGNKWNIWWPLLVISAFEGIIEEIFHLGPEIDMVAFEEYGKFSMNMSTSSYVGLSVLGIIMSVISACYLKYLVNFVRTGKFETNDIIDTLKSKWLDILISVILVSVIVGICTAVFVIPGIIVGLAYTLAVFLVVDKDVKGSDSLKESRQLMKGHKWEYFVFMLSFIGWFLLLPFTLGILAIWLVPYITIANVIYYDELTKDYALVSEK